MSVPSRTDTLERVSLRSSQQVHLSPEGRGARPRDDPTSSKSALALFQRAPEIEGRRADRHRQHDKDHAERERLAQVALAGFKGDRRRHGARIAADIAADNADGADFG